MDSDAFWIIKGSGSTKNLKNPTSIEAKTSNIGKSIGNSSGGDTLSTFMVKTVLLMDNSRGSKGTNVTEYDASDLTQTWENYCDKSIGNYWGKYPSPCKMGS